MAYLSLETFEKTDKESRQQARNAFRTEDPSTERLYWAIPNMRDNEKWRSRMSKKAQKLYFSVFIIIFSLHGTHWECSAASTKGSIDPHNDHKDTDSELILLLISTPSLISN